MFLEPHIQRRILASVGYVELELYQEAVDELEAIPQPFQEATPVLASWLELYQRWKKFDEAFEVAQHLAEIEPDDPRWSVALAYSARRSKGILIARRILQNALQRFPDFAVIHFNLACYAAQLGELEHAQKHLEEAIAFDQEFLKQAQIDPDLEPLRRSGRSGFSGRW